MSHLGWRPAAWLAATVLSLGLLTVMAPGRAVALESGTPLPASPDGTVANGVAYVGDTIFASFRPDASPGADGTVYRTPADGSGSWEPVTSPGTSTALTAPADGLVARGDAMVLPAPVDDASTPCDDYVLITPTGQRALESCGSAPVLGHGGQLVARRTSVDDHGYWVVERVSDGVAVLDTTTAPVISGAVVWRLYASTVAGTDTDSSTTIGRKVPPECAAGELVDAFGRFVLVRCNGGSVLIDSAGTLTPRLLPQGDWSLGDGFVHDAQPDPSAPAHRVVRVMELTRAQTMHTYGWTSSGDPNDAVGRAEPDDTGAPEMAMVTEAGEVRRLALNWIGAPPTASDDTVPPVIEGTAGSPDVVHEQSPSGYPDTTLVFSWTAHDPGDAGSPVYDVRAYSTRDGKPMNGLSVPATAGMVGTSVVARESSIDVLDCFQVRARDWVGNLTLGDQGWSTPRCTWIASDVPSTYSVRSVEDRLGFPNRLGPRTVPYRYASLDDSDPAALTHDVDYRLAGPRESLGPWISPPSWQHITATTVSRVVPTGGEICFRARTRDLGSVGAYSDPWCSSVPYDDRDFRIHHGAKHVRVEGALGHTATKLRRGRGSITLRGIQARRVWVRTVGGTPKFCVTITLGKRHGNGCLIEYDGGARWEEYRFKPGSHGKLRIRGWRKLVDAVAVVR